MTKIHVLKDEDLGGIEREYVEVERDGVVGDWVVGKLGNPYKVVGVNEDGDVYINSGLFIRSYYRTVEPTDIVCIDGERFRMVDRKANVGERVIVTNDWYDAKSGNTLSIIDGSDFGFSADRENKEVFYKHPDNSKSQIRFISGNFYRVLVPADSEIAPQSQDDIIANLIRRVAQLESELSGAKRDIETWAQEVESLKHEVVQPKQITLDVDTFAKLIGGVR